MNSKSPLIASAIRTIKIEKEAVSALESRIGGDFERACSLILECKGRVVVTGIGKHPATAQRRAERGVVDGDDGLQP